MLVVMFDLFASGRGSKKPTKMKTITIPCTMMAMALLALGARGADSSYKPEELVSVPTLALYEEAEIAKNVGKVVRLRFGRKDENSSNKSLFLAVENVVNGYYRTGSISLAVPPEGEQWAAGVRIKGSARAGELVYARVLSKYNAQALGIKIVSGPKGKTLAW